MAYVKVSTTKNAIATLRYGEHEQGVVRGGVDCPHDTETAIRLFRADRIMWNKDDGLQAHVIIQSFADCDNITPERANELGQELAKKVAPGHRAMIYTHCENGYKHNHIVICAINQLDGKKLDTYGMLWKCRDASNELSRENGLSVIQYGREAGVFTKSADLRYTLAEQNMVDKGKQCWKNDIREAVENGMKHCRTMDEFRGRLKEQGITINERRSKQTESGKQWTYCTQYEGKEVRVRAAKLGEAYTLENVSRELSREKVSALDKVQEMQNAGKSTLDKANQLINGKVQQEQDRLRQLEAIRQLSRLQEREKEQEKGFELGR